MTGHWKSNRNEGNIARILVENIDRVGGITKLNGSVIADPGIHLPYESSVIIFRLY
jgi:hypothetical protein